MLLNVEDFRRKARKALPRLVFDYVNGAAEDVLAAARALAALQQRHQQAGARVQAGHHVDHRQGHLQRFTVRFAIEAHDAGESLHGGAVAGVAASGLEVPKPEIDKWTRRGKRRRLCQIEGQCALVAV